MEGFNSSIIEEDNVDKNLNDGWITKLLKTIGIIKPKAPQKLLSTIMAVKNVETK